MKKISFFKMELIGTIFTFLIGTILHFVYDISNHSVWSILIGAINESVWEHVKIFILPYLFWGAIEICYLKIPMKKTIIAKTIGIYIFSIITILFFYSYSNIAKGSILLVDIISVFLWIILAHVISYKIIIFKKSFENLFTPSAFLLVLLITMYLTFSVNPLHIDLFKDPITNSYGLYQKW